MKNIDYFKFGATKLEDVSVLHIEGEFESVIELLQGQVTSDCSMLSDSFGQVSALCDEKGTSKALVQSLNQEQKDNIVELLKKDNIVEYKGKVALPV